MHKCLDAFVDDRAWPQAIGALERLIAAEKVDTVRAKYHHTAGLIWRDELKQPISAAAHLGAALDDDPELERSARALEQVLKGLREWQELARLYRRWVKTLGPESPNDADGKNQERLRLWSELGELCLRPLGEPQAALAAYEVALSFDRDNFDRQKQLADLYLEAGSDAVDKAIAAHQLVLRREKGRVSSYRALRALYAHSRERGKAFACSYALLLLKKGDRDDARAVAEIRKRGLGHGAPQARRADLDAPDASRRGPAHRLPAGAGGADDRRRPRPDAQAGRAQPQGRAPGPRSALLRQGAEVRDGDPRRGHARGVRAARAAAGGAVRQHVDGYELVPVLQLGAPLVGKGRREPDQVFELGRRGALLRPERLLRLAAPHPQQIGHVLEAAIALVYDAEGAPPMPSPDLQRTVAGLKRALPPRSSSRCSRSARRCARAACAPTKPRCSGCRLRT